MGLFDRLFGKKEEPKIEEVVKEALEILICLKIQKLREFLKKKQKIAEESSA